MHKRKNHNAPQEHAGPTTVPEGTEQGDGAEVLSPLASCLQGCTYDTAYQSSCILACSSSAMLRISITASPALSLLQLRAEG